MTNPPPDDITTPNPFTFNISLSVLNHLGRHLYRSFVTVLGEAVSNSWDADAENVWIYLDKQNHQLVIKDDGQGMSDEDFQNKFLKIGYSKRKDDERKSPNGRPYIGRKGIGKLALLSCANRITIISKKAGDHYVGGCIDNAGLDLAIKDDLSANEYSLGEWSEDIFKPYMEEHTKGTIIHFDQIKGGIRNTVGYLRKIVALYFRFSLLDDGFNIFIDDEKITHEHIGDISKKTEFLWKLNTYSDPYISECLTELKENQNLSSTMNIKGFISSVEKPSHLKIRETEECLTVDFFVNGRLREKDILKNIPSARVVESYLYGQIHFDEFDDGDDPFTSNREGVATDNPSYQLLLSELRNKILPSVMKQWDEWRRKHREDGDPENKKIPKAQRKSEELYNAVSEEYDQPKGSPNKLKIDGWIRSLGDDARFNFASYAECFISENLIRKYIEEKQMPLSPEAIEQIGKYREKESAAKEKGNISIDIRASENDLTYLSMDDLAAFVDKKDPIKESCLLRDSREYKPMRDALMHTAILGSVAKNRLTSVYENIKARVNKLLKGGE